MIIPLGMSEARSRQCRKEPSDLLLRDVWQAQLIGPDDPMNQTGALLISAELCTKGIGVLRVHEDFTELLGVATWNPAREVPPFARPNPAREILEAARVDTRQDFIRTLSAELTTELQRNIRKALGTSAASFTDEEILNGIHAPDKPLISWRQVLPKLRSRLSPYFAACEPRFLGVP
jgi:hypothetical protein